MRSALSRLAFTFAFTLALTLALTTTARAQAALEKQATLERGQKEEQRTCLPCHSLRIIHSNRLSRAGWNKELDKMAGWGAKYSDRAAMLEYLVANFGDDKPVAPPENTVDARTKQ